MNSGLALVGIERVFVTAAASLRVLRGVALEVHPGEMVALLGPSGAGKSTLLHIAGLLERPDGGEVLIAGTPSQTITGPGSSGNAFSPTVSYSKLANATGYIVRGCRRAAL